MTELDVNSSLQLESKQAKIEGYFFTKCMPCSYDRTNEPDLESPHKFKSAARREYEATYRNEILLNERFKQFVSNMKYAYEGENTRKEQVKSAKVIEGGKHRYSGTFPREIAIFREIPLHLGCPGYTVLAAGE